MNTKVEFLLTYTLTYFYKYTILRKGDTAFTLLKIPSPNIVYSSLHKSIDVKLRNPSGHRELDEGAVLNSDLMARDPACHHVTITLTPAAGQPLSWKHGDTRLGSASPSMTDT